MKRQKEAIGAYDEDENEMKRLQVETTGSRERAGR